MATSLNGEGWRLELPDGLSAKPHAARGYDSGAIARGWIGDAPVTVIVQAKRLQGEFDEWVRQVAADWLEQEPPRRIAVSGASDAVRIDGYVEFDGLGAAGDREQCIAICTKWRRRAVAMTIRCRPEDGVQAELEPIVASFELARADGG